MSSVPEYTDEFDDDVEDFPKECIMRPQRRQKTKKKMLLQKASDDRITVEVNAFGVHCGDGWTNLTNYCGVLVKDYVSIIYDDWRHVPDKVKDELWKYLLELFVLTSRSKKQVFATMSVALRQFRFELRNDFILQHMDDLTKLRYPPERYKHIRTDEWRVFVKKTFTEEFQVKSQRGKDMRKKNKYNHRLGSTGYAGLLKKKEKELGANVVDIDRADTWVWGHQGKDGEFDDEVKAIVEKIKEMKTKVDEGSLVASGVNDVMTLALGKKPNGSRVQGMGHFITPSMYFDMPKPCMSERQKEKSICEKRYEMMVEQLRDMKAQLSSYAGSDIGSCSVATKSPSGEIGKRKVAVEVEKPAHTPKKTRIHSQLSKSPRHTSVEKEVASPITGPKPNKQRKDKKPEVYSEKSPKEVDVDDDMGWLEEPVAVHFGADEEQQCTKTKKFQRCTPKKIETNSRLPRRSPRHILHKTDTPFEGVKEELGNDGVEVLKVNRSQMKKKSVPVRKLTMQRTTRSIVEKRQGQSMNMKMFSILIERCLGDGYMIPNDAEVFGFPTKSVFNKEMCRIVIKCEKVSNSVIEIWCKNLYEKMLEDGGEMPVQFGTSAAIPRPKRPSHDSITRRSQYVSDLLGVGLLGQITLLPYNS
ncbi:unnamed protein product, partial [Cuscuta epithymum]